MSRHFIFLSLVSIFILGFALLFSTGCTGGNPPYGTPLYVEQGADPYGNPGLKVTSIYIQPAGVNLAVSGMQKFKATATYNNGSIDDVTAKVEWYTESPGMGKFEPSGNRFLAQKTGVAIVRCRVAQGKGFAVSNAAFVNIFNPNLDNPPMVPLNPSLLDTPEGVRVSWDLNQTDTDLIGYNLYRTQVSTAHYAIEFDVTALAHYATDHRLNDAPILYPPFLDKTTVGGWYYYRVTAEDVLKLQSAPSEEISLFVTAQHHYGGAFDAGTTAAEEQSYKDALSAAF